MISSRLLSPLLAILLVIFQAGSIAAGGKVDDLVKALHSDPSYKVRTQAALLLGKLGDKSAIAALIKALGDDSKTVRAMSAQSLGKLGGDAAGSALRALSIREEDSFVRAQITRALSLIGPAKPPAETDKDKKVSVRIGPFSGGTKTADAALLELIRTRLRQSLEKLPLLVFAEGIEAKPHGKNEQAAFLVDGSVVRLEESGSGPGIETKCEVKVMVARWPSRSIILWTSAGAAVSGGKRDREKLVARQDCLEASVTQLADSLIGYFKSHGT